MLTSLSANTYEEALREKVIEVPLIHHPPVCTAMSQLELFVLNERKEVCCTYDGTSTTEQINTLLVC